jgi:hypothetical protein
LLRKPGALPGATALAQARASGAFTLTHDSFWAAARKAFGDTSGTRALIEVLLLHRHLEHVDVLAGITAALSVGSVSADVVAVQAAKPRSGAACTQRRSRQHRVGSRWSASPSVASSTCQLMTGRCPRSRSTTTCSGRPAHEPIDPAWCY